MCRALFAETYAKKLVIEAKGLGNSKILEVGCGSGVTLRKVKEVATNAEYFGIDFSTEALNATKQLNPNCLLVKADATHLPFKNETFDLVYTAGVIEHFLRDEAIKILCEQSRITKTTGTLVAIVPIRFSGIDLIKNLRFTPLWIWHFIDENDFPFTRKELIDLFKRSKLNHVKVATLNLNVFLASYSRDKQNCAVCSNHE